MEEMLKDVCHEFLHDDSKDSPPSKWQTQD
jgi:hypothetical protein